MAPWIDFQRIKSEARFEPILARYKLKLEGTGSQRSILCPFHKETRPSCRVNLDKRIFHCFGCEAAGNILEFVAKMEGDCSLRQAALIVAESCKIELADTPRRGKARKSVAEGPKAKGVPEVPLKPQRPVSEAPGASGEAVNPPLTFTLQLDPAHPYLAERGVSPEVVKLFGLGYCPRGVGREPDGWGKSLFRVADRRLGDIRRTNCPYIPCLYGRMYPRASFSGREKPGLE